MLKLEVDYILQLEVLKEYYFVHDQLMTWMMAQKQHCKRIGRNQAN